VPTIILQFHAHQMPDPDDLHSRIACPSIITGSEDGAHSTSFVLKDLIPGCKLKILPGGGHTCHFEQPWLFNRFMIEFLREHKLLPSIDNRLSG
jgi:pimeloyl-ACP methyl ester carboxylesterase